MLKDPPPISEEIRAEIRSLCRRSISGDKTLTPEDVARSLYLGHFYEADYGLIHGQELRRAQRALNPLSS